MGVDEDKNVKEAQGCLDSKLLLFSNILRC
jgi:hypothetical protein